MTKAMYDALDDKEKAFFDAFMKMYAELVKTNLLLAAILKDE